MEFPSLIINAPALVPVCTVTAEVIANPGHVAAATSAINVEPSAVSDKPDATTAMSGHNDMASRHQASATLATTDKELFPDPIFASDACSAMGIELSTIHIGVHVACSTKCPSVFIDITAPAAVYATAEVVTLDLFHAPPSGVLATTCIGIILSDGPDIIVDAALPAYWMDDFVMLNTSCEASAVNSWLFLLDWVELQPWPPPPDLKCITGGPVLRPLPWPSFCYYKTEEQFKLLLDIFAISSSEILSMPIARLGFLIRVTTLSRLSTEGECAILPKQSWQPLMVHVQVGYWAICGHRYTSASLPPRNVMSVDAELIKYQECIIVFRESFRCAEVHAVNGLIFGADEIYIQSSRGVVVVLSGLIWLLEHSIDLFKKLAELILWPSSVLMHVLGFGVKLRPVPWPYFICGKSFGLFMLKSERPGGLLTTEGGICMVMSVLTTWARTKAISHSSHGAWELFFSTVMQHLEQISKLLQFRAGSMCIGDMVTFLVLELAMDPELKQLWEPGGTTELEHHVSVLVLAALKLLRFIRVKGNARVISLCLSLGVFRLKSQHQGELCWPVLILGGTIANVVVDKILHIVSALQLLNDSRIHEGSATAEACVSATSTATLVLKFEMGSALQELQELGGTKSFDNNGSVLILQLTKSCLPMQLHLYEPWDPGGLDTAAWGQAAFQGEGNVRYVARFGPSRWIEWACTMGWMASAELWPRAHVAGVQDCSRRRTDEASNTSSSSGSSPPL